MRRQIASILALVRPSSSSHRWLATALSVMAGLTIAVVVAACRQDEEATAPVAESSERRGEGPLDPALVARGREIFRFDHFGDPTFWTDTLRMHEVIQGTIGPGVSPNTALAVGLRVDADALPESLKEALAAGEVDLDDPATTVALLGLGAVLGVVGEVDASNTLRRVGITCALCHSTVDNSFAPGIGRRLDGWPNRALDPGAIIALSPALTPAQRAVYESWGPGLYDPRFSIDGKNIPVVLPPAFGLRGVAREVYTGDGPVSYWNAYVAITQMHGHGRFVDERIGVRVNNPPDLVSSKLAALRAYQFSLETPRPVPGSFHEPAARRGRIVFEASGCARCHLGDKLTDVNLGRLHPPSEVGQDPAYVARTATKLYRTTPLRGLWNPPLLTGPYFHDGSAATLEDVVEHYVSHFDLSLSAQQKADLVEYLKTL